MSTRKDFIRNMLMGFAVTLLPKVLLPSDGSVYEISDNAIENIEDYSHLYSRNYEIRIYLGTDAYRKWNKEFDRLRKESWEKHKYHGRE